MSPAARVIEKCGGPARTAELARCTTNYVYRWRISSDRGGLGGRVPEKARRRLLDAARAGLVSVTPSDFEHGWAA